MLDSWSRSSARLRAAKGLSLPTALRRRRATHLSIAFVAAALCSATALGESAISFGIAAAAASVQDLIDQRSPGLRTGANMVKGKPALAQARTARALPRVRESRGSPEAPIAAPVAALPLPFAAPAAGGPGVIVPGEGVPGGIFAAGGSPGLFGGIPGGFGGGGGGGGLIVGGPGIAPPADTPAAVPEPAQWAMMIIGFGVIGSALRNRRRGRAAA